MKHLKLFEEFYFYGKDEEEETCSSCGCEECECTGEEGEENYDEVPETESEPNEMPNMFGEEGMGEEMPDMGGDESGFRRIKPFSAMGEEEEEVPFEEEEEDIILPVDRKFEAKKSKTSSYKKSELKNPEKADLNKDKKISGYEKARGKAIQKSIESEDEKTPSEGKGASKKKTNKEELPAGLKKAIKAGVRD